MVEKKDVDWDLIEKDYRSGIKSLRNIGSEFGVSDMLIRRKAKQEHWIRNLKEKIIDRADEIVFSNGVRDKIRIAEYDTVESKAAQIACVLLSERADIIKLSGIAEKYELELEDYQEDPEKKFRTLKCAVDIREKIFNLRRRNYNINDAYNSNEQSMEITEIKRIIVRVNGNQNPGSI